jgi:hypothetical protein
MAKRRDRERRGKGSVSMRRRAQDHKSGFTSTSVKLPEGMSFFSPKKEGTYRLRVVPYPIKEVGANPFAKDDDGNPLPEGALYPERTYFSHRGIGADNNTYVCSKRTFGKPCYICEHRAKLMKKPDADEDLISDLAPKERQLFLVNEPGNKDKADQLQLWDISFHLFGKHLDKKIRHADSDDNYHLFADPEHGSLLKLGAEEKSFGKTNYLEFSEIEFKQAEALDEDLLAKAKEICLDECLVEMDYDELKKIYLQEEDPAKGKKDKGKKGKPKPKDEDDEDEDEDEEEEEDDDEDDDEDETAKDKGIKKGASVEHKKLGECEVKKISSDGTKLVLEDEAGEEHKNIPVSAVELADEDDDEDEDDDDEDEDDDKPKKGKGKKEKKPSLDEEDDDDDDEDGEDDDDDDDEDDEDEPKKGKGKPAKGKKGKPKDEDDDEDEDDDDEDDDDDDEDKPKKGKKGKPKDEDEPLDDDDDDDDEDEEDDDNDDEDEDKPKKGKKKK